MSRCGIYCISWYWLGRLENCRRMSAKTTTTLGIWRNSGGREAKNPKEGREAGKFMNSSAHKSRSVWRCIFFMLVAAKNIFAYRWMNLVFIVLFWEVQAFSFLFLFEYCFSPKVNQKSFVYIFVSVRLTNRIRLFLFSLQYLQKF